MRKLLVVMIVLGMASMANAQLYLTINGMDNPTDEIVVISGDVLTIDIYGDGGTAPNYFFIDIDGVFTWDISQATIDYAGSNKDLSIIDDVEDLDLNIPSVFLILDDVPPGTMEPLPLGPYPKPLIDTILLTLGLGEGLTEDNQTITLYDDDLGVMQTYDVHITPEPTTMCLLGFGGLALLRKRGK